MKKTLSLLVVAFATCLMMFAEDPGLYLKKGDALTPVKVTRLSNTKKGGSAGAFSIGKEEHKIKGVTSGLTYAKEDSSPLKTSSFDIPAGYSTTLDSNLVEGLNITSNTYYYVYYTLSTNDGKYVETEDVQIYQACDLGTNGTITHFAYGSMDIPEGAEDGDEKKETPDSNLPNAGEKMIIFAAVGVSALGAVVLFRKVKSTKIK